MQTPKKIIDGIATLSEELKTDLKFELEQQGHKDTGNLINSIHYDIVKENGNIVVVFSYLDYGKDMNDGIKAANVKRLAGIDLKTLEDWAARKGFKNPKWAAIRINQKHLKEGMPTKNSFKFSKNGRRTGWQDHVLKEHKKQMPSKLQQKIINPLSAYFFDMLKNVKI